MRRRLSSTEVNETDEYFYMDMNGLGPAPVRSERRSFVCNEISALARRARPSFGKQRFETYE